MTIKRLSFSDLMDKVAVVMGTRPGIVKMAPLVKQFIKRDVENFIIHTGQHYSESMDAVFFQALEIPPPLHHIGSMENFSTHAEQTAKMMKGVEKVLLDTRPKVVLVCGDANTNLAAGLAARKLGLILGHVESGLRSHDWSMPEEHNRIILDHISEILFAPTIETCRNLIMDNVRGEIHLTGNTIVDSTIQVTEIAERKGIKVEDFGVENSRYCLVTCHREENVDNPVRLKKIFEGIEDIVRKTGWKAIFPAHPRTKKRLNELGMFETLVATDWIDVIEPTGYLEFNVLIKNAGIILTDSGGVQEEACILRTPCVTLRENTERPETIKNGCNFLAGTSPEQISHAAMIMRNVERIWDVPFGDGKAAVRIADMVENTFYQRVRLLDVASRTRSSYGETFKMREV